MAQTITSMSVDSTCRLHASRTLNLLPCLSSHCIGEPGKLHTKTGCIIRYQQSDILQAVNTSVPAALSLLFMCCMLIKARIPYVSFR